MKHISRKSLSSILFIFALAMVFTLIPANQTQAANKITHKFSGVDYLLTKGKTVTLKNSSVVKWTSENSKVASVSGNGKVTAKSAGVTTIIGTTKYGSTCTYDVGVKTNSFIPAYKTRYKVGKDMPAGTYAVIHDPKSSSKYTYWDIHNKKKNGKLLNNDGFSYTSIVTLKKGEYFELNGGYAVPLNKAAKSVFSVKNLNKYSASYSYYYGGAAKVGYGLPAGTYKITLCKGASSGCITLMNKPKDKDAYNHNKTVDNTYISKSSNKSATITLKKGQYVYFYGCQFKKVK